MDKVLSIKIEDSMAELIEEMAREEKTGKSPAARKLLHLGAREWKLERAVQAVIDEKASVWKASEMAGVSLREFLDALQERKIDWVGIHTSELEEEMNRIKGSE